ncbi:MAG: MarR family transcriptional regulator [Ignavibacterium sp.]|jgi:DNA-binding MarR family transcriptional regulator|nr:MarR family transcriptional regulator [Ignavibacterium sp.]
MNKKNLAEHLSNISNRLFTFQQEYNTRLAAERGLTEAEFRCLRLIGSDKGLSNKNIAERMNLSQSRLTRIIDGLVKKGYITRELNQKDSRCLNLTLSRKAKAFIQKLNERYNKMHLKVLKEINISQQKYFINGMEKLYTESEKWMGKNK